MDQNNELNLFLNDDKEVKVIKLGNNRKTYFNKEYDLTLIEIKENDNINNYLELDGNLFKDETKAYFKDISIYVLQYPLGKKAVFSYGLSVDINNYEIKNLCNTEHGSSDSPILNLTNNKVIGIHKQGSKNFNYNLGTILKFPLNDFLTSYKNEFKFNDILNNLRKIYKPGKPKINIIFNSTRGFRSIVEVSIGTTIEELLKRYILRFLNRPDLIGSKNLFFFNALRINFGDKTPVEKYFKGNPDVITVNDLSYLDDYNYGWAEEELEQLLLQEEKICPEIRNLPMPLPKEKIINVKFNNKGKIIEIKISNIDIVQNLITKYLKETNKFYNNIILSFNGYMLEIEDFSILFQIGLNNNSEIAVFESK